MNLHGAATSGDAASAGGVRRTRLRVLCVALGLLGFGACAEEPVTHLPEVLQPAETGEYARKARLPCGMFPLAGLDAPVGAEDGEDPRSDALMRAIRDSPDLDERTTWRLTHEEAERAMYVAEQEDSWLCLVLARQGDKWVAVEEAEATDLYVTLADDLGPARWRPTSMHASDDGIALVMLVQEQDCASGTAPTGRIAPPLVEYAEDSVTVTIGIRRVDTTAGLTCPTNPWTPVVLLLPADVGDRVLLDGSVYPPREATGDGTH